MKANTIKSIIKWLAYIFSALAAGYGGGQLG